MGSIHKEAGSPHLNHLLAVFIFWACGFNPYFKNLYVIYPLFPRIKKIWSNLTNSIPLPHSPKDAYRFLCLPIYLILGLLSEYRIRILILSSITCLLLEYFSWMEKGPQKKQNKRWVYSSIVVKSKPQTLMWSLGEREKCMDAIHLFCYGDLRRKRTHSKIVYFVPWIMKWLKNITIFKNLFLSIRSVWYMT